MSGDNTERQEDHPMNKISDISGLSKSMPVQKPARAQEGNEFQQVFNKALETLPLEKDSSTTPNTLGEIRMPVVNRVEEMNKNLADQTGNLLDRLDAFAQALGDPSRSLKEIETMVTDLKKSADALSEKAESKSTQGNSLQQIAKESAMTAALEYFKFYRGDYM